MPTETIYPMDCYAANDASWGELFQESSWYWGTSGARSLGDINYALIIDAFADSPQFNDAILGAGANHTDSGASQVWVGKTQTWTAAEVFIVYETTTGGPAWNDGNYDFTIENDGVAVDTIGTATQVGTTTTTFSFGLDVADWGTNFVEITNAVIFAVPRDNGTNPPTNAAHLLVRDIYIVGTYTAPMGGATLKSLEVPLDFNDVSLNWNAGGVTGGWWIPFTTGPIFNERWAVNVSSQWDSDPDMHAPSVYNDKANWTDHTNGEAESQAFFVLDHIIIGEDNDNYRWMLVTGASGGTDVEALYTSPLGNGDRTDTSANISTAGDWDLHNLEARFDGTAGMADVIRSSVYRFWCDVEFAGLTGTVHVVSMAPEGALDSTCFMAGEIPIGGNPTFMIESDASASIGVQTEWILTCRAEARLDGGSDYATTNGLEGCYLHGAFNVSMRAEALLDGICGSRINTKTIDDTTVVTYRLILKDVTALLPEIELPCQRVGSTSRNGAISRATFVIPDVDTHLPLLNTRLDGTLELRAVLDNVDGTIENAALIVEINISEIETIREGSLSEITVTGSKQRTFGAGKNWLIQAEGNWAEGEEFGSDFIETLDDPRVQPGDFIDIRGANQIMIKEIEREINGSGTRVMILRPV